MSLNKGLKEYIRKVKAGEIKKAKHIDPIEKSEQNPGSFRFAITAKCYECSGCVKVDVTNCDIYDCPLYIHRPWQNKAST
jgi:hypothetical protein